MSKSIRSRICYIQKALLARGEKEKKSIKIYSRNLEQCAATERLRVMYDSKYLHMLDDAPIVPRLPSANPFDGNMA